MVLQDALLNAFVTFFVTIDPPGLMGIFLALTTGMTSQQRRQTALRGTLIGIIILLGFMLVGGIILETLGISMSAFRIAGGLLLFYIAFEMVFEMRAERKEETAEKIARLHRNRCDSIISSSAVERQCELLVDALAMMLR